MLYKWYDILVGWLFGDGPRSQGWMSFRQGAAWSSISTDPPSAQSKQNSGNTTLMAQEHC